MDYYRDTTLEINLDHVFDNATNLMASLGPKITMMAVIKADSYGHGAVMVAKTLIEAGVKYLAVATLDEALELRQAGIGISILILGGIRICDLSIIQKQHLTIAIHSLEWLRKALLEYSGQAIDVHLKFDTGMNRLGLIGETDAHEALKLIKESSVFHLKGILSHLATSEETDETYYAMQVERFEHFLQSLDLLGLWIHLGNSAGSLKQRPLHVNMVRIGLFLNGIAPAKTSLPHFTLKPSLRLISHLVQIKTLPAGTKVSYNGLYETTNIEHIGTIPIGYADGFDRRLIGGRVFIEGEYCPIVGRICMDYCLVKLPKPYPEGTAVELIGEHISIDEYASKINTNSYQATCQFSDRLPRIYSRHGIVVNIVNRRLMSKIGGSS